MIEKSLAQPTRTQHLEAIEREIARLKRRRPELLGRIQRAEHIIVTQLSCRASVRPVRVRIHADCSKTFIVRSCSTRALTYRVGPDFRCDCSDARRRCSTKPPACTHSIACYVIERALLRSRESSCCSGCGKRVPGRDLTEVQDYYESLSYFAGDMLCSECFSGSDCW